MSVLNQIEPTAQEITKEEYEKRMGIIPVGGEVKAVEDVGQPVGEDTEEEVSSPLSRGQALKILVARGFNYKDIKTKTKEQLIEML